MSNKFDVISPDGISIHPTDTYETEQDAEIAFTKWLERYAVQGYYSSKGERIPLDKVKYHSQIVPV